MGGDPGAQLITPIYACILSVQCCSKLSAPDAHLTPKLLAISNENEVPILCPLAVPQKRFGKDAGQIIEVLGLWDEHGKEFMAWKEAPPPPTQQQQPAVSPMAAAAVPAAAVAAAAAGAAASRGSPGAPADAGAILISWVPVLSMLPSIIVEGAFSRDHHSMVGF